MGSCWFSKEMRKQRLFYVLLLFVTLVGCKDESPIVDTKANSLVDITSKDQFDTDIKAGVSLIFYHASWCTRCAEQRPAVEAISEEEAFNTVYFGEVEYEDFSSIVDDRSIKGFPTIVIYKDDKEEKRFTGKGHSTKEIRTALQAVVQ